MEFQMSLPRPAVQFGKVRINSAISASERILTSTQRISAFDCVLPFEVEDKGSLLQAISAYFFTSTRDIIPNHFIGCLDSQSMLVKSGRVLPLEVIARGTLTGSLWRSYNTGGLQEVRRTWGIELPTGLTQHARFATPIVTYTTKAAFGHDETVTPIQATENVKDWLLRLQIASPADAAQFAERLMTQVAAAALKLFQRGQEVAQNAELLLMDTKYEFALDDKNQLMLVDEIHTPDASRYIDLKDFNAGKIEHFSKEWLRELIQSQLKNETTAVQDSEKNLPFVLKSFWTKNNFKQIAAHETSRRYKELFSRLFPQLSPWDVIARHLVPWPVEPANLRRAENLQRLPGRVLVVGSGGRDFTLANLLERQPDVDVVYCWPGRDSWNGGKKKSLGNISLEQLKDVCSTENIGWAVFGPEMPIAQGIAESLRAQNIPCLAPDLQGARLEVSKIYNKEILKAAGCPTAESWTVSWNDLKSCAETNPAVARTNLPILNQYPYVLKFESLAAGKGVCLVLNEADRRDAISHFETNLPAWLKELDDLAVETLTRTSGEPQFLIEKLLPGSEISAIALCRGEDYALLPYAQDFKRRNDGQTGPNTGGMGAVCPVEIPATLEKQIHDIFQRTLKTLKRNGTPYRGFLFAGLMVDENNQAQVLEYNCRLGDPETQVILPGMGRDLLLLMWLTSKNEAWSNNPWRNDVTPHALSHDSKKRCFVVLASPEYPNTSASRRVLSLPPVWPHGSEWIPSGVDAQESTSAGRIAGVLCTADSELQAVEGAYAAVGTICFKGEAPLRPHYRTDIGFPKTNAKPRG